MSLKVDPKQPSQTPQNASVEKPKKQNFFHWWLDQMHEGYMMERKPEAYCTAQWNSQSSTTKKSQAEFMKDCFKRCAFAKQLAEWHQKS